jgi:hypothetical protein
VAQVAKWQGRSVFAFTRPGDVATQAFARRLGATWAGGSDEMPPEPLDAAIIFATVGDLVPLALKAVRKGGSVVCAGIHMSDIPSFPYRLLWEERQLVSVANLTRQDGIDFLRLAPEIGIVTKTTRYPLNRPIKPSPISAPADSKARRRFFLRQSDSLNEEPKSNPSGPPVPIGWLELFSPRKKQAKKPLTATMQRNFTTGEKKPRDFSFNYN